jgi:hypothetical protein
MVVVCSLIASLGGYCKQQAAAGWGGGLQVDGGFSLAAFAFIFVNGPEEDALILPLLIACKRAKCDVTSAACGSIIVQRDDAA